MRPEIKTRLYSGFETDEEKLSFYINKGFERQYSVLMENEISKNLTYILPEEFKISELKLNNEDRFNEYKTMYDEIFITPLSLEDYRELEKKNKFKNLVFYIGDNLIGGATVLEEQGFGYIETLYVTQGNRGKGYGKSILIYIWDYFKSNNITQTRLEVWELNKKAINYQTIYK